MYIQRANEDSSYPQLARMLVSYNGRVGFAPDLKTALDEVFGAGAGAGVPVPPGSPVEGTGPPANGAVPGVDLAVAPDLAAAAQGIRTAIDQLDAANRSGDLGAVGAAIQALDAAVEQFQAVQVTTGG